MYNNNTSNNISVNDIFQEKKSGMHYIEFYLYPIDIQDGKSYYFDIYGSNGYILYGFFDAFSDSLKIKTGAGWNTYTVSGDEWHHVN